MKRYIEITADNYISDICHDHNKKTNCNIYYDEVLLPSDVWINGKCISDELGNPLFKYVDGVVSEVDTSIYQDQYDEAERIKTNETLTAEISQLDSISIRDIREWTVLQKDCPASLIALNAAIKVKRDKIK